MSAATSPRVGESSDIDSVASESIADEAVEDEKAGETVTDVDERDHDEQPARVWRRIRWSRVIAYALLPGLALALASAAGFLKWQDASIRGAAAARAESMQAATEGTIALLSYRADTVQKDLE